ncbi:hypothetical protein L210DRAFT_3539182 [Boletus edulis BED1]|uniref:VTT domain-containing protein n=1 Tax=Boletus edulis BED1 TaxID=1328754 RepID=A0AAD4BUS7_BOLED|nr:hypothetical protein L210DRAFT_3539182 [Boletus edulis BED1]
MAALFLLATLVLGGTLFLVLPTLEPDDRPFLRIPKSFDDLKALNGLLKKYRDIYPTRIVICYVITYLFLQAFSLPGSMYLSILGGAVWGVPIALPLACTCIATGATLCYFISAAFGPALLTVPRWKAHLDTWSEKLRQQRDNIVSFLIILRIAPLPPHWVINIVCPHVGIGLVPFWTSTWLGVFGANVIHTTIGGGLDEMTSAADFHLISWKNFFLLSAVVVGVLIPVGLRYYFKREVASAATVEDPDLLEDLPGDDRILAVGPAPLPKKPTSPLGSIYVSKGNTFYSDRQVGQDQDIDDDDDEDDEDDEDVILEAGPAIVIKDGSSSGSATH